MSSVAIVGSRLTFTASRRSPRSRRHRDSLEGGLLSQRIRLRHPRTSCARRTCFRNPPKPIYLEKPRGAAAPRLNGFSLRRHYALLFDVKLAYRTRRARIDRRELPASSPAGKRSVNMTARDSNRSHATEIDPLPAFQPMRTDDRGFNGKRFVC